MLKHLMYRLVGPLRAWSSMKETRRQALLMHLGHTKIIGWEGASPIHTLFIPGEFSSPMVRSRARMFNMLRFGRTMPVLCDFGMTNACQCTCQHCSAWGQQGTELDTTAWKKAVDDSLALGVYVIIFTGGEPLLRPDLAEIIAHVDKDQALPVLFTNGLLLAQRAQELHRAGLNRVLVSFDSPDAERHDANRGVPGTFAKAMEGIAACKKLGMLTAISTFADAQRLADGTMDGLVKLGKDLGVNEVVFFDALPTGRWKNRTAIPPEGHPHYQHLKTWVDARQQEYPNMGIWSYRQVRSLTSCGCSAGTTTFKIAFNGDVQPCDFCHRTIGNITNESLEKLWNRLQGMARRENATGTGCWLMRELHEKKTQTETSSCTSV